MYHFLYKRELEMRNYSAKMKIAVKRFVKKQVAKIPLLEVKEHPDTGEWGVFFENQLFAHYDYGSHWILPVDRIGVLDRFRDKEAAVSIVPKLEKIFSGAYRMKLEHFWRKGDFLRKKYSG